MPGAGREKGSAEPAPVAEARNELSRAKMARLLIGLSVIGAGLIIGGGECAADLVAGGWLQPPPVQPASPTAPSPAPERVLRRAPSPRVPRHPVNRKPPAAAPTTPSDGRVRF